MRKVAFFTILLFFFGWMQVDAQLALETDVVMNDGSSRASSLTENERAELIAALINGECQFNGINLWGKVQFVEHFPDIKVQFVEHFPDIKVKYVEHFPDRCGLWQVTEHFPDFKIQVVQHFPDIKVKVVDHFPGME